MNNRRMILHVLGEILFVEALLMLLPVTVALIYNESSSYFLISALITGAVGSFFLAIPIKDRRIYYSDGFSIVAIGWTLMSLAGALPFFLSGEIPSFIDAFFESVSGFTTTGASILTDVEALTHASLFWRSFTHWIGGMGVLVFLMVLIPVAGGGGNLNLMRAESPGVEVEKLVPKSNHTARILYGIYFALTLIQFIILWIAGMPLFDAVTITFGTAGTGGFAVLNSGLSGYSMFCQGVVAVFMMLFGINFNLYFLLLCRRFREVWRSEELRAYLIIMGVVTLVVTFDVYAYGFYSSFFDALHHSFFQVSSVMTTTGFATADFNLWPEVSRIVILLVMCIGSCAGSTAGGLKVSRVTVAIKSVFVEMRRVLNPRRVSVVKYGGKKISDSLIRTTFAYIVIYIGIIVVSLLVISFDRMDFTTNFSGVIATLNNIGPGLGEVGPTGNFAAYGAVSKITFCLNMLLGRLEIYPILIVGYSFFRIKRTRISQD